jgi:hypothetical protein
MKVCLDRSFLPFPMKGVSTNLSACKKYLRLTGFQSLPSPVSCMDQIFDNSMLHSSFPRSNIKKVDRPVDFLLVES